MSIINKMLQDLDARGTPPGDPLPSQVRPVAGTARPGATHARLRAAGGATVAVLLAAGLGWFGYSRYAAPHAAPAQAVPMPKPQAAAPRTPPAGMTSTITMGDAAAGAAPAPAATAAAPAAAAAPAVHADVAEPPAPARSPAQPKPRHATDAVGATAAAPKSVMPFEPDSEEARAERQAVMRALETRMAAMARTGRAAPGTAAAARPARADEPPKRGAERQDSAFRRAEGDYRRALVSLQDGRMGESIAALEAALKIDPSHEAARQTLVGLLVEAGRGDDAMRQLQLGLTLDPRQPALAMLLARLQIERGANGIDTLLRTLPYAGNSPDYHAFLAGALQRQGRHREAAEQYQVALRAAPDNGVWWMGLGMSLQADKRNADALDAFQKARAAGLPSPELQAFVERRVLQLAR